MKRYGIREDYVPRTEALTVSEDPSRYWNRQRIATSSYYQFPVYEKAAEFLRSRQERSFVDVGCGYPAKARELILPVTDDVTLVDHPSMRAIVERDFPEMRFLPIDLEAGNDALRERFDCVVSADVIEHLLDPDLLLRFLHDRLEPGGALFLSTPERDVLRGRDCLSSPKAEHVREWNSDELRRYLAGSGLELVEHHLLPQGRLSRWEKRALPVLQRLLPKRYRACQLAVCGLPAS